MGAPLDAFVAGQYYCFYTQPVVSGFGSSTPTYTEIGVTVQPMAGVPAWVGASSRGFTLTSTMVAELVEGDIWGGSVADIVYRGGNMFLQWDAIAFAYASLAPFWPWATLGTIGVVGRLGSVLGGSVVLVAAPGTTASNTPAIGQASLLALTAPNAILAEGQNMDLVFDSRLRRVPVRLRLLPFYSQSANVNGGANAGGAAATFQVPAIGGGFVNALGVTPDPLATAAPLPISIVTVPMYKWYNIS